MRFLYIIYRHKWKIVLCALAGLAAAMVYRLLVPALYESQAKLLVRYVVERSAIDPVDGQEGGGSDIRSGDSVISEEVEILTSWDLALDVVDTVGANRLLPDSTGPADRILAARVVAASLTVTPLRGSNVILISYANRDPELAALVLQELLNRYFIKHLEVHRSLGAFDFVSQQTDQVRGLLEQTDQDLKKQKDEAGILSVDDSTASVNASLAKGREELAGAEADLAEEQGRVNEMEKLLSAGGAPSPSASENANAATASAGPDNSEIEHYQALVGHLEEMHKAEFDLLAKYTPESDEVKTCREEIATLELERQALEIKYPSLLSAAPKAGSPDGSQPDLNMERIRLTGLSARVDTLRKQVQDIEARAAQLVDAGTQISQLERRKEVEETNLKYFESSLEKARIDEALDPSKMPNISVIQKPCAAVRVSRRKMLLGIAGAGIGAGVMLALMIDLLFDRSIKRPADLEAQLRAPLMLSIPFFPKLARRRLQLGANGENSAAVVRKGQPAEVAIWDPNHTLAPYSEAIRDRLILSFQLKNLIHKPKLVGVTGLTGGEGASAIAASLAAALSETGDGKVLLVDLNPTHARAHPFFDGKPALGLSNALAANGSLLAASGNVYLATGSSENGGSMQLASKRFSSLMPKLKESNFDYVIFDLPPLSRSSATLAVAGGLDKLLMVVEAEKSDRNDVKRAYNEFVTAKADVTCILNKTRSSGPKWLVG